MSGKAMEEAAKPKWNSLIVPSVQELAKKEITEIPDRYIRPDQQQEIIVSESDDLPEIPVIDMQRLITEESASSEELAKLHLACKNWGFFQLVNHGVGSRLVEKMKEETHEFFNLGMSEKNKFWQREDDVEGFGQAFVVSEDQKLDWGDLFFINTLPVHLRKPHLFPQLPLPFRETLELYSAEMKNLAVAIMEQMEKALKMESMEMRELFKEGMQSMRMNYYPPCPQPHKVIGLTPHSDAVGLTILLQLNEVEGLQIRKDGMWVPVRPLPNAFVLNIGDILEIITNGTYRSIEHRAMVNSERERLSIATFYSPRYDAEIGPSPSLVTDHTPPKFKRIGVDEYFRGLFSRELQGKSYLEAMRIQQCNGNEEKTE
ncbi:protein SRG1-like [Neltuma alba]|uniref:protein SRG1-like n=1 Tax=Neltuma alba TaxID=207710 RepID=UPI0010A30BE8|nr:protein SRG1-like [Prosopis alba]